MAPEPRVSERLSVRTNFPETSKSNTPMGVGEYARLFRKLHDSNCHGKARLVGISSPRLHGCPGSAKNEMSRVQNPISPLFSGGEGGIRTHGTREGSTVFETARFNRSRTSPIGASALTRSRYYTKSVYRGPRYTTVESSRFRFSSGEGATPRL